MKKKDLDQAFEEAVEIANNTNLRFPPDLMLYFYAYYKRASGQNREHKVDNLNQEKLISAFKMNALFQVQNLTQAEAKQKYIDLVNKYIVDSKK
ncbi:acyl-CoA-binding protein [Haloflavibacter putidus]|uniref:Acyl-CoA-binding protein n=1 Tax=Haloflavibacter putidus TaxID=2576776 RepID=A0A507ZLW4_9FLAO|nr:acyl-CoA-binding protein [Haloflavibacter putidus]TQD38666.1 acyl-CoA-binding protein [Haloflavibacter putidus]